MERSSVDAAYTRQAGRSMSMWELEALAEGLVRVVGRSALPVAEKRQLYGAAYGLVGDFDVSFVHFLTEERLVDGQLLHRITPSTAHVGSRPCLHSA